MDKFKLDFSMQFPFFELKELVTYSEVKKPSGITYILLVLIRESKGKNDRLSTVLENFGIPKTLHYVFAENILYLINQGILEDNDFNVNQFGEYRIGDFKFTPKGEKIFAEESIPTGINKDIKLAVYYNIALNELSLKINTDLEPRPLMDSAITPEFMSQFSCEKDVESFLNLQKGKGIGIKKEEVITDVAQLENNNWVAKYDPEITINGNNVDITFDNPVLQKFFEKYYSKDIINKAISYKSKYRFSSAYKDNLRLNDYDSSKIVNVYIPKDINEILKQKSQLIVSKGNYKSQINYEVDCKEALDSYNESLEFIQVDLHDYIFGYIPGNFVFKNEVFGEIIIPLVLKIQINKDELKEILKPYINQLVEYSEDNFKELVKVTGITNDLSSAEIIINGYLDDDVEHNLVVLNEIKQFAISNAGILNIYKKLLKENYDLYMEFVDEDNLETVLKITSSIPKFLNISEKDVLANIFSNIRIQNPLNVYEVMANKGFDKALLLTYVNPVEEALKVRNVKDPGLIELVSYDAALEKLKTITGISDYKDYAFDVEKINRNDFKSAYNIVFNVGKRIQIFKNANSQLFDKYDGFVHVFTMINDEFNLLDAALKNPNNIKPELIDKKISSGDYQFVFVNLSARLEFILKNKYKLDGTLSDMLSQARRDSLIDKNIVSDLHDFRENRNANIHPEDRKANYNANDLRRWAKEIFDLEESK